MWEDTSTRNKWTSDIRTKTATNTDDELISQLLKEAVSLQVKIINSTERKVK